MNTFLILYLIKFYIKIGFVINKSNNMNLIKIGQKQIREDKNIKEAT